MRSRVIKREAGVAAILSFVFTGLGQIYNGQIKKGLWLVAVATLGITLALVGGLVIAISLFHSFFSLKLFLYSGLSLLLGGVIICWSGIYSIVDAYKSACD